MAELGSITLKVVTDKAEVTLWNEYVDRHHYLSYKHPIGAALKYFIMSDHPQPQVLGCFRRAMLPHEIPGLLSP
ncbi:Druantia anti-phage system protein DruA [Bathymodiolus platifrons methanotrophic gill symbiont]|uniref:Druantia anti-phage system protein DruA n=1 Tax=Bathymodiolus platifrons methanotrophic gill symbiont TaxID=113268 RepID=UPI001C8DEC3B